MRKRFLTFIIVLTTILSSVAQTTITGRITDAWTGEPLIGATLVPKSSKELGAVTDADGNFRLTTKVQLPLTLVVQFIGYRSQEVDVYDAAEPVDIQLTEQRNQLSEVVVIGYGTQKRTQLTGSVTTLDQDVLKNTVVPTIDGILGGAVAGVQVTTSNQPGASSTIRIRGGNSVNANNDPLYVIDGFIYYTDAGSRSTGVNGIQGGVSPLAFLNASDIESIEVLKDVSATAIYGSRGANGVILITTKSGKRGQSHITYEYSLGISSSAKKLSLLNAQQFARFQKDYFYNKEGFTDAEIAALGEGTDWQDAVLRTAFTHNHHVTVSGGNDNVRYSFGGNIVNQDGIIINSDYRRSALRLNIDAQVTDKLTAGLVGNISKSTQNGLTTTSAKSYNSSPYSAGITSSLTYALFMPPTQPVYEADGSYNYHNPYEYAYFALGDHAANPVSDLENSVAETIDDSSIGNVYARYAFADGWNLKGSFGFNIANITQNFFAPSYTAIGLQEQGIGSIGKRRSETWQTEFTLGYTKQLNADHYLDALLGYTYQTCERSRLTATSNHYSNETLKENNLAGGSEYYAPASGSSNANLHSLLGRVNYTWKDRYNVTATLRADRSSRFAKNHEWGWFPSIGLSWNADREQFLKKVKWISSLKWRFSIGSVGNQEIGDYEYSDSYSASSYGGVTAYSKSKEANDNLKWETTVSYNIGLDLAVFSDRLRLIADYYFKKTNDLLLNVPVSTLTYGVSSMLQNIGNVTNQGIELSLAATLLSTKDLQWTLNGNVAHNVNKITDVAGYEQLVTGNTILRKDEAIGSFYGLVFDGIVQLDDDRSKLPTQNGAVPEPGQEKFRDLNGDGKVDQNDRTIIGQTQPKVTFGLSSSFSFRHWDVFIQFQGATGHSVYNSLRRALELPTDCYNVSADLLNAWTPENPSNTIPRISDTRPYSLIDSRYVEKADYLKLKTLTVGYNLTIKELKKVRIEAVRFYATASNLLTITSYKGYDPEVRGGVDTGIYPAERTFTFGASITF